MYRLIDGLYRLARPTVFRLTDPEQAHRLACRAIGCLGQEGWLAEELANQVWRLGGYANHQAVLGQTVGGVYFPNPVGLAGGFVKDGLLAHLMHLFGFGSVEAGTFTLYPREGNPRPRLQRAPDVRGFYNAMGWNGPGAPTGAANLADRVRTIPVGINVGSTPDVESVDLAIQSIVDTVRVLGQYASYLTINPSCSNVRVTNFQDPFLLRALLDALRGQLPEFADKLTFVKLKPDTSPEQVDALGVVCVSKRVGLILGNTFGTEQGALSGPALYAGIPGYVESLPDRIAHAYEATGGFVPLIACGGIETAEQAYELVGRGASLVQIYTSWVYNGPFWLREMCEGLARLLRRDGLKHVSVVRGTIRGGETG